MPKVLGRMSPVQTWTEIKTKLKMLQIPVEKKESLQIVNGRQWPLWWLSNWGEANGGEKKMHILQIYILVFPVTSRAAFFFSINEEIPKYEIQLHPNNKPVNETTGSLFQKAKPLNQAKYRLSLEKAWKRKWPSSSSPPRSASSDRYNECVPQSEVRVVGFPADNAIACSGSHANFLIILLGFFITIRILIIHM